MFFLTIVDYVFIIDSALWIMLGSWSFGGSGSNSFVQEQSLSVGVQKRIILIKVGLDHAICNSLGAFQYTGSSTYFTGSLKKKKSMKI